MPITIRIPVSVSMSICVPVYVCGLFRCSSLLVRPEVEVDEEEQVACQKEAAEEGSVLRSGTVPDVREERIVVGSEMLIS